MYTALTDKVVKCRKPHQCEWCAQRIEVGEIVPYRSYIWEGDFNSGWMHPECNEAMAEVALNERDFSFCPGDFPRGGTEAY